ncbi:hypothetical protein N7G274_007184 [Stereocaulon virgatum]|uniref:Uncharacterized protein n=1 Tax=Stereocaulon virgatum TaxID=373712 RepID=A0ABR4A5T8_9LECA
MNDRLVEWIRQREEQVQRFTPAEIKAEIIRQNIEKLESLRLLPASPGYDPRSFLEGIEHLKRRLATVQQPVARIAEGRIRMVNSFGLARRALATGGIPPESVDTLKNCQTWLDTLEEERRRRKRVELWVLRQDWKTAGWNTRIGMLRWLGRWGTREVVGSSLKYKASRVAMKAAIWLFRR